MQDTHILGTGNSRSMKIPADRAVVYQTVQDMVNDMIAGNFMMDIGPLNPAGCDVIGTDNNKANLLDTKTGSITRAETVNEALLHLAGGSGSVANRVVEIIKSTRTWTAPPNLSGDVFALCFGGGGGGGGGSAGNSGGGGGGGHMDFALCPLVPGESVQILIGAGGTYSHNVVTGDATGGGTTSFGNFVSAAGGEGGKGGWNDAGLGGKGGSGGTGGGGGTGSVRGGDGGNGSYGGGGGGGGGPTKGQGGTGGTFGGNGGTAAYGNAGNGMRLPDLLFYPYKIEISDDDDGGYGVSTSSGGGGGGLNSKGGPGDSGGGGGGGGFGYEGHNSASNSAGGGGGIRISNSPLGTSMTEYASGGTRNNGASGVCILIYYVKGVFEE